MNLPKIAVYTNELCWRTAYYDWWRDAGLRGGGVTRLGGAPRAAKQRSTYLVLFGGLTGPSALIATIQGNKSQGEQDLQGFSLSSSSGDPARCSAKSASTRLRPPALGSGLTPLWHEKVAGGRGPSFSSPLLQLQGQKRKLINYLNVAAKMSSHFSSSRFLQIYLFFFLGVSMPPPLTPDINCFSMGIVLFGCCSDNYLIINEDIVFVLKIKLIFKVYENDKERAGFQSKNPFLKRYHCFFPPENFILKGTVL